MALLHGRNIVSENPYESSEAVTSIQQSVIPMTITWAHIWLAAFLTSAIVVAVLLLLAGCTTVLDGLFEWAVSVCAFLFTPAGAENNGPSLAIGIP